MTANDTRKAAGKPDEQPEALATFAASARSNEKVSPYGGLDAIRETKAIPDNPSAKHDGATKILREYVTCQDENGIEAARSLADRTRERPAVRKPRWSIPDLACQPVTFALAWGMSGHNL